MRGKSAGMRSKGWGRLRLHKGDLILLLTLALVAALAAADAGAGSSSDRASTPQAQWYSMHLDGRKIGSLLSQRIVSESTVETLQQLTLELERNGESLRIDSTQSMKETREGQPLSFRNVLNMGGSDVVIDGRVAAAIATIRIAQGGSEREQQLDWPTDALLAEGQLLAVARAGTSPGTRYAYTLFDLDALQAMRVETEVVGMQNIDLFERTEHLLALKQTIKADGSTSDSELWLRPNDFALRRMRMPMLGAFLDAIACDRPCAERPNQAIDILSATSISAPRALSTGERQRRLQYSLRIDGDLPPLTPLPGQTSLALAGGLQITIDPRGSVDRAPESADREANRWLQSDSAELIELASVLAGDATSAAETMHRLQEGVARHIKTKSLRIGYASALESARLGEGDCTEHALLLAALGRAQGIPTRVASGLAFVPSFAGKRSVFVPHAWVYAWVDERWQGYDAALSGFDSGHLALDVGDGDPFGFYAGLTLLGRLSITEIKRVKR